jgi:glycosyltransferase involved in cell wall biosynthesis
VRALIVTSMYPTPARPMWGVFVRDQVEALRKLDDVEIEVFAVRPDGARAYVDAGREIRRRYGHSRFDVVHAHFGLSAWPALFAQARRRVVTLHGTDLAHPRSRAITIGALRFYDLIATVSSELGRSVPQWTRRREVAVLPCGVDADRFRPRPRTEVRAVVGLDPHAPYLLFPADPDRPEKRYDRARQVAGEVPLLVLKNTDPQEVPLWVNAANAVLGPSEREGFGLAVLEALACDVPVVATPVGIAPEALDGIAGAYCGAFDPGAWRTALEPHLAADDPRIPGRARAEQYSSERMAARVLEAWRGLLN